MTVASLWKVLDKAGCGKPVGATELLHHRRGTDQLVPPATNPWNCNERSRPSLANKRVALAIDLSIWICESLTSQAMTDNHANPTLHLVFTRTMKLLSRGVKLVFVIEGKRRIRGSGSEQDKFHKRRSGTAFWNACRDCQEMLGLLGVPVVRAKAEGEALCALLNQRGIVDGVISNDGDCLLFGAKVVYTKFSIENLENSQVKRYDLADLSAVVDASDDKETRDAQDEKVSFSRNDLIAFALLTGSDLAGDGLSKVGQKKAIRFVRKCQLDNPLTTETASIDELKSWACAAMANVPIATVEPEKKGDRCCSHCTHPGSKRRHEKHGCELCGTKAGEPCFKVTSDDRFRKSLRAKALAMQPKFDPSQVVAAYMRPNDNQIPSQLVGRTAETLRMGRPNLHQLMRMPLIVKGTSLSASRDYVKQSVARLLARVELFGDGDDLLPHSNAPPQRLARERPVPQRITKALIKNQIPCYQVVWMVNATVTDDQGEGMDGYEYTTVEERDLIEARYPFLLTQFQEAEKERAKQGDGEKNRRRAFLESLLVNTNLGNEHDGDQASPIKRKAQVKKRQGFFQTKRPRLNQEPSGRKAHHGGGDDVGNLLRFIVKPEGVTSKGHAPFDYSTIESKTYIPEAVILNQAKTVPFRPTTPTTPILDPDCSIVCDMGIPVEITPIESNQGQFPPRHIFVRSK